MIGNDNPPQTMSLRDAIAEGIVDTCARCHWRLEAHIVCGCCTQCCPC